MDEWLERLAHRIVGAEVSVVVDTDLSRAKNAVEAIGSGVAVSDLGQVLDQEDVNAVLVATPGFLHRDILLRVRERDLPISCEKPLTPDAASSWEIVEAEQRFGKKRIQVGFMRRFDAGYQRLREIICADELGELLMLHCSHRNPDTPPDFTNHGRRESNQSCPSNLAPFTPGALPKRLLSAKSAPGRAKGLNNHPTFRM